METFGKHAGERVGNPIDAYLLVRSFTKDQKRLADLAESIGECGEAVERAGRGPRGPTQKRAREYRNRRVAKRDGCEFLRRKRGDVVSEAEAEDDRNRSESSKRNEDGILSLRYLYDRRTSRRTLVPDNVENTNLARRVCFAPCHRGPLNTLVESVFVYLLSGECGLVVPRCRRSHLPRCVSGPHSRPLRRHPVPDICRPFVKNEADGLDETASVALAKEPETLELSSVVGDDADFVLIRARGSNPLSEFFHFHLFSHRYLRKKLV